MRKKITSLRYFLLSAFMFVTLALPIYAAAQEDTNPPGSPPASDLQFNFDPNYAAPKQKQSTGTSTTSDPCAELNNLKAKFSKLGGSDLVAKGKIPSYCSTAELYKKIIDLALLFIGIAGVIAIIYGGYLYMTARGDQFQSKKARSVLTWAIVGIIVVLAAVVIVNIVVKLLVQ